MRISLQADHLKFPLPLGKGSEITWMNSNSEGLIPDADLYIWDYAPDAGLDSTVLGRPAAQHLVVVDPKYVDALASIQNCICILLKPVTPFTLNAFVELAFKNWEARRQAREVETLRLDRDTLLQYVLEVNLRLQEYDQARSNFLARALHDFRAPLTALHGYCGLLADGKLGAISPPQRQLLERMSYSTKRLARLAGGTLELLLQGRFEKLTETREACIEETLSQALADVAPFVQDKALKVDVQITKYEGRLFFEPEKIHQVLVNLLENSCKFTPKNGNIQIRGYPIPGHRSESAHAARSTRPANMYRVDICDSGPGVPPNLAERIFEEFASYSGANDRSGGGLGLAICKSIIAAHHGTIWATPGEDGGRFSFVLPLTPASKPLLVNQTAEDKTFERQNAACG